MQQKHGHILAFIKSKLQFPNHKQIAISNFQTSNIRRLDPPRTPPRRRMKITQFGYWDLSLEYYLFTIKLIIKGVHELTSFGCYLLFVFCDFIIPLSFNLAYVNLPVRI